MKAIGRQGGKARSRPGTGGKQLSTSLRERLRASINEDRLAEVLVSGLKSESAKERLDVAKLVLAELAVDPKIQGWVCTCHSAPGEYCRQLEEHGYRSVNRAHFGLADLVETAFERGILEADGEVRTGGVPLKNTRTPPPTKNPAGGRPQMGRSWRGRSPLWPLLLHRHEQLDVAAVLAHKHRHLFAACKQLAEVTEDESPGPGAFVKVLLAREDQPAIAARAAGVLVRLRAGLDGLFELRLVLHAQSSL